MICKECGLEKKNYGLGLCNNCYMINYRKKNLDKERQIARQNYQKNRLKECNRTKRWRLENPEKYKETQRKSREKNKAHIKLYEKQYRLKNKERLNKRDKENMRRWRINNREKSKECDRHWRRNNREKDRAADKRWRENHPDYYNNYRQNRETVDIDFKIRNWYSCRVGIAIRNQFGNKAYKTIELLGCSIQHCREYLEKQFKPGMSWENYGYRGWHIDHKIPCSNFDLTKKEEQKKCFHYTNLQPLWAKENLSKGNKIFP